MKEISKKKENKTRTVSRVKKAVSTIPERKILDEEEIRIKANSIYNLRIEFDIEGSPEDDWYQAERLLRDTQDISEITSN